LVPGHAIQSLGEDDLELAALRVLQQRLNTGRRITLAPEMAAS
jgi:hypothetical protein